MPPTLALVLWLVMLVALLVLDPAKDSGTSLILWVPVSWMFIVGSRLPSQWTGFAVGMGPSALEEGNPLDRVIFLVLIAVAVGTLISRSFNWGAFFTRNMALTAFIAFALLSVLWSDFPFVSLKRWFRDFGNYLMVLVVLVDPRPLEAVRTLLRRFCYLLIPLSLLLVKYYPRIGVQYEPWTGADMFVGATTSKNMLGVACLVSGLFFFWDTLTRWTDRKQRRTRRIILVNGAFMAMTLWLLHISQSATSQVCLAIGCLTVMAAHRGVGRRHIGVLKVMIPLSFVVYLVLAFGLGLQAQLAHAVGRNATLTDRTIIWKILLSLNTNPIVGTGYESFWLGSRLGYVWRTYDAINEAHNGYLEIYLSLGLIGLFLIGGFLVASYRTICRRLESASCFGTLSLAMWSMLVFYNVTEAAFRFHLMWFAFLLGAIALPSGAEDRLSDAAIGNKRESTHFSRIPLADVKRLASSGKRAHNNGAEKEDVSEVSSLHRRR
jgi:exopolysaccharide production protein ExoQ